MRVDLSQYIKKTKQRSNVSSAINIFYEEPPFEKDDQFEHSCSWVKFEKKWERFCEKAFRVAHIRLLEIYGAYFTSMLIA